MTSSMLKGRFIQTVCSFRKITIRGCKSWPSCKSLCSSVLYIFWPHTRLFVLHKGEKPCVSPLNTLLSALHFWHSEHFPSGHQMCVSFSSIPADFQASVGCPLQFIQFWHSLPRDNIRLHTWRVQSPLQRPLCPDCYLGLWPIGYKSEAPMTLFGFK